MLTIFYIPVLFLIGSRTETSAFTGSKEAYLVICFENSKWHGVNNRLEMVAIRVC